MRAAVLGCKRRAGRPPCAWRCGDVRRAGSALLLLFLTAALPPHPHVARRPRSECLPSNADAFGGVNSPALCRSISEHGATGFSRAVERGLRLEAGDGPEQRTRLLLAHKDQANDVDPAGGV